MRENRYRDNRRDNGSDGWNKKQEKCSSKRQELIIFKVVI